MYVKQGTVTLVDGEPPPPTLPNFEAKEGWKLVKNITVTSSGGDYTFPPDQILRVTRDGHYKEMPMVEERALANLKRVSYLVWYHHLWTPQQWTQKKAAQGRGHAG